MITEKIAEDVVWCNQTVCIQNDLRVLTAKPRLDKRRFDQNIPDFLIPVTLDGEERYSCAGNWMSMTY